MGLLILPHHNHHFRYHFPHQLRPHDHKYCSNFSFQFWLLLWALTALQIGLGWATLHLPVRVTLLCDNATYQDCVLNADVMSAHKVSDPAISVSVVPIPDTGPQALRTLGQAVGGKELKALDVDVLMALGNADAVQGAIVLASGLDLPLLGYVNDDSYQSVNTESYLSANADPVSQGATLATLIGQYNVPHTHILIQDIFLSTGFLQGFRSKGEGDYKDSLLGRSTLRSQSSDKQIADLLEKLAMKGWKFVVLHCQPQLMLRVIQQAVSSSLFGTGYGWFLSETAMSYDAKELRALPEGLLGLRSFYQKGTMGLLQAAAETIRCAYTCMQECNILPPVPSPFHPKSSFSSPSYINSSSSSPSNSQSGKKPLRISCDATTKYFTKCVRYSPGCRQSAVHFNASWSPSILQNGSAYQLLNLVSSGKTERIWESVGFISHSGQTDLKTVMWPGHTIFSPSALTARTYRVVSRPARPFVYVEGPVMSEEDCFMDIPCLQMPNSSTDYVLNVVRNFLSRNRQQNMDYSLFCCKGISLDILKKLSDDLSFQYVIYLVNDSNYGELQNNTWTGMVGDVLSGSADLIMGAFSMTSSRMQAISFTEPYYYNEFSLVTAEDDRTPSIWAFLSPFSAQVWTCILLSSLVAGVATSALEWFSPFGLNPRGRKRRKQYSLGSGLLMVWVLVTGHTINIKAPKSWPSKVIQNVWAGLAIFIMTSYTANLAAYLAGQSAIISVKSINDSKLLHKRVSVIRSSAVQHHLHHINPDLYHKTRHNYVTSTAEGIRLLQAGQIDVYLDDYLLLEYEVSRMDKDCQIQFVDKGFGSDVYAFGLSKQSWMRMALSNKILSYRDSGFIQQVSHKYITHSRCSHFLSGSAVQYGLEHTGGLFFILLTAISFSLLLLFLEHLAYRFLIPWFRSRPDCSFWKTENFAFFSQRVHRVVRSEKLYSQKQAAQEMIKIVRQRDFTRLIQKNELQKRKILPQKRAKTKAEMFQEITANIVSYHRQLKEPDVAMDSDDQDQHEESSSGLSYDVDHVPTVPSRHTVPYDVDHVPTVPSRHTVPYDVDHFPTVPSRHTVPNDVDHVPTVPSRHTVACGSLGENHIGMNNVAYYPKGEQRRRPLDNVHSVAGGIRVKGGKGMEKEEEDNLVVNNEVTVSSLSKRHSRSSRGSVRTPCRKTEFKNKSRAKSASEPTSPEAEEISIRWHPTQSAQNRRVSDLSPVRLPNKHPHKNNARSRSQEYQNWDCFQRNLRLKDNRVKSTLCHQAMTSNHSQASDECLPHWPLEALSKEDLLILWKKSELELQSKLNDVLSRNKRLASAIQYLTQQQQEEEV